MPEADFVPVTKNARMQAVLDSIARMGAERWPVLILGDTGTGKEVLARLIHRKGNPGPFVIIDCSAIPANLMESELFGHVKGAFTGAGTARTGLIEAAHGGTAFFDEIGELPLDMQAKLLRVLQEKEFRPVGSTHRRRSDFRAIAATNRDLAAEVERGTFRRDLFYRLKVVTLRIPPLRERPEDIPHLVQHFLARYGNRHSLTPEAMQTLLAWEWPGNVRELENCIQQMVAAATGPLLHQHQMPSTVFNQVAVAQSPLLGLSAAAGASSFPSVVNAQTEPDSGEGPIVPLQEMERREILRAVRFTRGDRTAAAVLLGIGRTTLYRKLKEYGISD